MPDPTAQLQSLLKKENCSFTLPRKVVFAALQHKEPQTMHDVVDVCGGQIDRSSVYRTIQLFERLGVVQRLQIGWKYKLELSDKFTNHHHHLSCTKCGRTVAIEEDVALEDRMHLLAERHNFLPQDHQLEIRGLCQRCQGL